MTFSDIGVTRVTKTRIRDKLEFDGIAQDMMKCRYGRKRSSNVNETADAFIQVFAQSPKNTVR